MSSVNKRQLRLLAPFLEGDRPTHSNTDRQTGEVTREWNLLCPLHPDQKRSASINIDKGLFFCNVCGGMTITSLIKRQSEWQTVNGNGNGNGRVLHLNGSAPVKERVELTEAMIDGWHSALMSSPGAIQWLRETRGLDLESLRRFRLGFKDGRLYTIPVLGDSNEIWNVRYYNPNPEDIRRKIWSESGYGSPNRLYPINVLVSDPGEVIVCEGEWDVMLALQNMYDAVTRTGAADVWMMEWGEWFANRTVYLAHDADDKGVRANKVVGDALHRIADVRVVTLPYPHVEKHGKDLTDLFLDHGPDALRSLLEEARPYKQRIRDVVPDESDTVTVLDTFNASHVGRPVKVIVTIKGRKEPGYTIPKVVLMACSQDAGTKCTGCPMMAAKGEARIEIGADDPMVLAMVDSSNSEVKALLTDSYGVPGGKCGKLQHEVEQHQSVEVLFARPALDYTDGSGESSHKDSHTNLTITSVGRHDTLASSTVAAIGALQPNPKSQRNEFLAHEVEVLETSVDRFELNDETVDLMRRFQAERRPLEKLAEINRSLAEHVTHIAGRPQMHAMMDLTFHSVLQWSFAEQFVERGWLECLALGDTRTGKSQVAKSLISHYNAGEIISCEAATFAGIVGGVQQLGGKDWAVTWGVIPTNDKRLVVLDEAGGLTPEEIGQLSDIRSSGQAKLIKVVQEVTWARTRLIWSANPRNSSMANYTYGVDALRPLIGNMEDIARFDMAMVVTLSDVPSEVINRPPSGGELVYTPEACHALLMWCWSRKPHQVIWTAGAEQAVFDAANQMGKMYVEDPPLVQAANIRIKIARVAVALAGRLFSTDETHENVIVTTAHVRDAMAFLNLLYGMQTFGYRERSRERISDRAEAEARRDDIEQFLKGRPQMAKYLRSAGKFRRQDLEEIMSISREEANGIISTLHEARMVRKVLGDVWVEPTLHALLREVKW